jgi:5'-nucleotidase
MRLLLTNDDGIRADGLLALERELRPLGEIVIVAPERQQSGVSHSLTLYRPLMVREAAHPYARMFAVDGTPADCVKLALVELLDEPPDVVVSGINFGLNVANNILYSGTLAGALEGALYGHPSFAISLEAGPEPRWSVAARIARRLIETILPKHRHRAGVFNINVPARPAASIKGTVVTRQEGLAWQDAFDRREDPRGRTYYWLKGTPERNYKKRPVTENGHVPTDAHAVRDGYVSVTPLQRDLTNHHLLADLGKLSKRFPVRRRKS